MNPFRDAPIFLLGFVIVLFSSNINYAKEVCVDGEEKSLRGSTMTCKKKDADIYDSWLNLFEIDDFRITSVELKTNNNERTIQSVGGFVGSSNFWLMADRLPKIYTGWSKALVSKSFIIKSTKESVQFHGKKFTKTHDPEYFYHRRAIFLRHRINNRDCVKFSRIKDEYYMIRLNLCFNGASPSVQEEQIEAVKKYLHKDIKFATRAENKAAYGNANRTTSASTSSSSSNTNRSIAGNSELTVCGIALAAEYEGTKWETGSGYTKYVDEAKRRGYTPASCAKALGRTATVTKSTSSKPSTSDQSFKRKMCESTKASAKVQASFMQSLSENELTKFLEAGQDCSIF